MTSLKRWIKAISVAVVLIFIAHYLFNSVNVENNYRLLFEIVKKKKKRFEKFEKTRWLNVYWYECCELQMILFLLFRIQQSSLTVIVNGILPS